MFAETESLLRNKPEDLSIWVVDDNANFRNSIISLLELERNVTTLKPFSSGDEVLKVVKEGSEMPNIILMDIRMESKEAGIEVTREIKKLRPDIKIIMVTGTDQAEAERLSFEAGAEAYLDKNQAAEDDLIITIKNVMRGKVAFDSFMAKKIVEQFKMFDELLHELAFSEDGSKKRIAEIIRTTMPALTDAEAGVLAETIKAPDLSDKEMAEKLNCTSSTINKHHANIRQKFNLHSKLAVMVQLFLSMLRGRVLNE